MENVKIKLIGLIATSITFNRKVIADVVFPLLLSVHREILLVNANKIYMREDEKEGSLNLPNPTQTNC